MKVEISIFVFNLVLYLAANGENKLKIKKLLLWLLKRFNCEGLKPKHKYGYYDYTYQTKWTPAHINFGLHNCQEINLNYKLKIQVSNSNSSVRTWNWWCRRPRISQSPTQTCWTAWTTSFQLSKGDTKICTRRNTMWRMMPTPTLYA